MNDSQPKPRQSLARRGRVDSASDEYERRWRAGENPRIESFLAEAEADDRELLLRELIVVDLMLCAEAGGNVDLAEYRSRFAGKDDIVDSAVDSFRNHDTKSCKQIDSARTPPPRSATNDSIPNAIGRDDRYQIIRVLGQGGFASVYLARDRDLEREVAIKVPRLERFDSEEALEFFVDEARKAAQLDHTGIVRVHDVQREPSLVYIVQQYIDGGDLTQHAKSHRLPYRRIAELMVSIAEAVGFAHQRGYSHLDLKPANILLDSAGAAYVADFGLALHESAQGGMRGQVLGTYAYMSPAQTRGELHRLDGRADIWSLGVILYELLTGRRPFKGKTREELVDQIEHHDPRPPRQIDPKIPPELSRITMACLAKRATDRYPATADLIDDLQQWLRDDATQAAPLEGVSTSDSSDSSATSPAKVIPQGLRSFEAEHADFYLDLLPGPFDREGLPRRVRFWKRRMDESDPDETFAVGLMYGPSGCGKSSMVKAGILPRLSENVLPVYVEATAADTETRLLKALRKRCPDLPADDDLRQLFSELRRCAGSRGRKVVVVIDQFEQWLHAHASADDSQLIPALRHCDGGGVQCVVLVRDDFWLSATRFMQALEMPIVEDSNSALVDLFDRDHAFQVLAAFGRAYGKLPELPSEPTEEQTRFLQQAVSGLADDAGKVVCVRLAVFAEMMKGRPWSVASLADVGGIEGVGVAFLEETFAAKTAPPAYRLHQQAIRAVLNELLPEQGTDIKGQMRSYQELLAASGYGDRHQDFDALLSILDGEVRLITPTEPDDVSGDADNETSASHAAYYQLAHDYLVPSLREWLTRKQQETRRGRAELKLAERAALWNAKPENRFLPSLPEWGRIGFLTDKQKWTGPQRRMMSRAGHVHAWRWGTGLAMVLVAGIAVQQFVASARHRNLLQSTKQAVAAMRVSRGILVPRAILDLKELPEQMVVDELNARFADSKPAEKLSLAYALADYGEIKTDFLLSGIAEAPVSECENIVAALDGVKESVPKAMSNLVKQADAAGDWILKGRLAVVALHLGNDELAVDVHADRPDPTHQTVFIHDVLPTWHGNLARLAEQCQSVDDGPLLAGLALALGNVPADEVGDAKAAWQDLLTRWYTESPDSGTHSAAGWALRQWKVDLPKIAPSPNPEDRDWKVTPHGFTLVRIPAGQFVRTDGKTNKTVTLTRDVWLSDIEVTVGLFQQFVGDDSYQGLKPKDWEGVDEQRSPSKQHPAQQVSWEDAVLFCNWLSEKDGRDACYKVEPLTTPTQYETLHVELLPSGTGYRLPTEAEWEYACRAGTTTAFGFGDDAERLKRYAVFSSTRTELSATKMCNRWGLFDIHGNVWELCYDLYGEYMGDNAEDPLGATEGRFRVYRGGCWNLTARNCGSSDRFWFYPTYRLSSLGFRVASVPSSERSEAEVKASGDDGAGR